ncbi:MAG: VTT domain-containing protein, partial [Cocleimonas sp.]
TITMGIAFGLWGFPIVVVGATIGAGMSFLAGRYLLRGQVEKALGHRPMYKALNEAIKEEGWKVVGLMRFSPAVPFSLQNWLFGITKVGFFPYILATFFGIMPGTLLYVWIGSISATAASGADTSTAKIAFLVIGIIATLVVTVFIGKKAKAKLEVHGLDKE